MYNVELIAQAEFELSEAYDWYEEQQTGLGNRFYHEIDRQLTLIGANPHHYPVKYASTLHAVTIKKFPFLIIYWIDNINKIIVVVSIFHTSKKPRLY